MVNYWLAKQEPTSYNFSSLKKEKKTVWDGVHNNLALKNIGKIKKGDKIFFYHSGKEKQVIGIMEVISNPYPNPEEDNKRFIVVDVKFNKQLKKPVTLEEIKKEKKYSNWDLLRISRLSVMPVPKQIWDFIIKKSEN